MAPVHGSNADVYGNGYVLSSFFNSASSSNSRDMGESTVFKKKSKTYVPGLKDNTLSCEGVYDGEEDAVDQILSAALSGDSVVVSYYPEGAEVFGSGAYTLDAQESSYEITTDVGDVAQVSAEFGAGPDGFFDRGKSYLPMAARTSTGNSSSIDLGDVSTNKGASLIIHVVSVEAAGLTISLQDSADDSAFADLDDIVLVDADDRTSQRLFIAGTVRRYTRVRWDGEGTFAVAAARF